MKTWKTEADATAEAPEGFKATELYTGVWILEEINPAPAPAMSRNAARLMGRYS